MRLITIEDIRDLYLKIAQRGVLFSLSKLSLKKDVRTKTAFNSLKIDSSNWWIIPEVKERWNELITESKIKTYEEFVSKNFFQDYRSLKMVSIGSGVCSHEILFAELNPHWEITCIDFSNKLLERAEEIAKEKGVSNIKFINENIYQSNLPNNYFDVVFFHSSLHHFRSLDEFINKIVMDKLTHRGYLIINEYVGVNRLQYSNTQIDAINQCLKLIPKSHRKLYKSPLYKKRYFGSGILRMVVADPSECVESESILPIINKYFDVVFEKPFGGNLLMPVLKDISHHFINEDRREQNQKILKAIFEIEDQYLTTNSSDFVFGIYQKKIREL